MRKDLIFDYETLSEDCLDGIMVDCSCFVFHWDRFTKDPYTFKEICENAVKYKVSAKDQKKEYGYKTSEGTMNFWKEQDKSVQKLIAPKDDDLSLSQFTSRFLNYIEKNGPVKYWWSRSNIFDPIFLQRQMKDTDKYAEFRSALYHSNVRDTRTYIDAKLDFPDLNGFVPVSDEDYWNEKFEKHNSTHDIAADVLRLQTITRLENDMEMTKR